MPKKITDITKRVEDLQEIKNQPEQIKEVPVSVEIEKIIEQIQPLEAPSPVKVEEKIEVPVISPAPAVTAPQPVKSPVLEKIENVLAEDLEEMYFQLPPEKQAEFRQAGELTATKIIVLLGAVKVQVKKILGLVIKWLRIIPHVNKYFLEQEAKIKTDRLLEMKEKGEIPTLENQNKI